MIGGLRLAWRGFQIVVLTAANVYQVAHSHYLGAFLCGTGISVVWFTNAKTAGVSEVRFANWWYGLGAGCGTVTGMALMRLVYG